MNYCRILEVCVEDGSLSVTLGPLFVLVGALIIGIWWGPRFWDALKGWRSYDIVSANISLPGIGSVEILPSHATIEIAYKAWVELATRKAALPFDEEHDLIIEIYDSWYALFKELRLLAKSVPANKLRECDDTQKLVDIMTKVLNEGLRPHLTQWQGRFRHWYKSSLGTSNSKTPQEVQREYPHYVELVNDLKRVNKGIVQYANWLREIADGKSESAATNLLCQRD